MSKSHLSMSLSARSFPMKQNHAAPFMIVASKGPFLSVQIIWSVFFSDLKKLRMFDTWALPKKSFWQKFKNTDVELLNNRFKNNITGSQFSSCCRKPQPPSLHQNDYYFKGYIGSDGDKSPEISFYTHLRKHFKLWRKYDYKILLVDVSQLQRPALHLSTSQ